MKPVRLQIENVCALSRLASCELFAMNLPEIIQIIIAGFFLFVCLFDYFVLFLVFLLLFICLFWPGLDGKNPWIKIMHLQTMTEGHEEINFGLD